MIMASIVAFASNFRPGNITAIDDYHLMAMGGFGIGWRTSRRYAGVLAILRACRSALASPSTGRRAWLEIAGRILLRP